jgi:hypothetical protein
LRYWSNIVNVRALTANQLLAQKSKKSPFELFKNHSIPIGSRVSYLILPWKNTSKLMSKGELGTHLAHNEKIQL